MDNFDKFKGHSFLEISICGHFDYNLELYEITVTAILAIHFFHSFVTQDYNI